MTMSETMHLLSEPKNAFGLTDPGLTFSVEALSRTRFRVEIVVERVALFVYLDCEVLGVFSDNGFILEESKKIVIFDTKKPSSREEVEKTLQISSYFNE